MKNGKGLLALFLLVILTISADVFALTQVGILASQQALSSSEQQLTIDQQHQALVQERLRKLTRELPDDLKQLPYEVIDQNRVNSANLALAKSETELEESSLTLTEAEQEVHKSANQINELEKQLQTTSFTRNHIKQQEVLTSLNYQKNLYKILQLRVNVLKQTQALLEEIVNLNKHYLEEVQKQYRNQQREVRKQQIQSQEITLQQQQQQWLVQLNRLNQQIANIAEHKGSEYHRIEMQIFYANEKINLNNMQLSQLHLTDQLNDLHEAIEIEDAHLAKLIAHEIYNELEGVRHLLKRKLELLQQQGQLSMAGQGKRLISWVDSQMDQAVQKELIHAYQNQQQALQEFIERYDVYQEQVENLSKQALAKRQGLPGLDLQAWRDLSDKLLHIPTLTWKALDNTRQTIVAGLLRMPPLGFYLLLGLEALWLLLWLYLRHAMHTVRPKDKGPWISANIVAVSIELLHRHLGSLFIFIGFLTLLLLIKISSKILTVFFSFAALYFAISLTMGLARLSLLETIGNHSGLDVKLYHRLKWGLLLGGALTGMMMWAQQIAISYVVSDFFTRLFMLFLLIVALLLLKGWQIIPSLLKGYFDGKRPYLKTVVNTLCLLLPLTLLVTAIIGLIGYVDLAWHIFTYGGIFLFVLTGYLVIRGILSDIVGIISVVIIQRLRNGWLWREAVLKPLDKLIRLAILILAIIALLRLYGWLMNVPIMARLDAMLTIHLFSLAGADLTLMTLFELFLLGYLLLWIARWTPEFAYRWLFAKTKDIGLRNSLAIFTQYTLVIIGIFIALKIVGIDLSVLKFIFGGLAVGAGFGLRDLANNFVSGVLLLIERPVRKGDMVTIGGYEGEITHIGMRSMTVKTWDYTEVLVPNSEAFSKSFTNWTHQDSIIRSIIAVKMDWNDNPQQVQGIIYSVLKDTPEIVAFPEPEVLLKEIADGILEFEIRYFINLQFNNSRPVVRSKVLVTIWERFKQQGIQPAHPQHEIHVKYPTADQNLF